MEPLDPAAAIAALLDKYDVRMAPDQRAKLVERLVHCCKMNPSDLVSDLSQLEGFSAPADGHPSMMVDHVVKKRMQLLSPIELIRFCGDGHRFPPASEATKRNWHRGGGELWEDRLGGDVFIQVLQAVNGGQEKPTLGLLHCNFPIHGMTAIYLARPKS